MDADLLDDPLLPDQPMGDDLADDVAEKGGRDRSTIAFPYVDLDDAIPVAKAVYDAGDAVDLPNLAAALKHESIQSGAFRMKVAGARIFGLIRVERKLVHVTGLGRKIVDANSEREARVEAFLHVPLYKRAFEKYNGYQLPSASGIESFFGFLGVAEKQRGRARQVFLRAAQQAGFFDAAKDRLVRPIVRQGGRQTGETTQPIETEQRTDQSDERASGSKPALIEALFKMVPDDGAPWDFESREKWLTTAKSILDLIYHD